MATEAPIWAKSILIGGVAFVGLVIFYCATVSWWRRSKYVDSPAVESEDEQTKEEIDGTTPDTAV